METGILKSFCKMLPRVNNFILIIYSPCGRFLNERERFLNCESGMPVRGSEDWKFALRLEREAWKDTSLKAPVLLETVKFML